MISSDLAFKLFRERIFGDLIVRKLQTGILTWVTWERNERYVLCPSIYLHNAHSLN
jgi:hypothetical protein